MRLAESNKLWLYLALGTMIAFSSAWHIYRHFRPATIREAATRARAGWRPRCFPSERRWVSPHREPERLEPSHCSSLTRLDTRAGCRHRPRVRPLPFAGRRRAAPGQRRIRCWAAGAPDRRRSARRRRGQHAGSADSKPHHAPGPFPVASHHRYSAVLEGRHAGRQLAMSFSYQPSLLSPVARRVQTCCCR